MAPPPAVASIPPPPSNGTLHHQQQQPPWKSHAVNRSNEFLSCARTALKIAQQQHRQRQQQQQQQGEFGGGYNPRTNNGDNNSTLPEWLENINPLELKLYQQPAQRHHHHHNGNAPNNDDDDDDDTAALIADSQTLLALLDSHLLELHTLVRRRGHTNDPTLDIQSVIERFQEGAKEVKEVCDALRLAGTRPCSSSLLFGDSSRSSRRSSSQRRKHYEMLSLQLEGQAKERTDRLKKELETRSQVLRDQSHRRKLLASGGVGGGATAGAAGRGGIGQGSVPPMGTRTANHQPTRLPSQSKAALNVSSQFQSPLFTATPGGGSGVTSTAAGRRNNASAAYSGYAGYGGTSTTTTTTTSGNGAAGGYAGYGGTTSAPPSFSTGMRQRKQQQQQQQPKSHIQIDSGADDNGNDDSKYNKSSQGDEYNSSSTTTSIQQQISLRREKRATHTRTQQARLAEKSIAELGVMFTKMSSLITQQGEVLERIEDDVEAAGVDIDAGHDELVKVYGMTKGNRGLILKVFGILIFLIVFMKLY